MIVWSYVHWEHELNHSYVETTKMNFTRRTWEGIGHQGGLNFEAYPKSQTSKHNFPKNLKDSVSIFPISREF
jgi:hypothetical protein